MRLQKFLALAGVASRRRAEQLIKNGSVKVNGEPGTLGTNVDPDRDQVEVDGKRAKPAALAYRLLLKPRACLATLQEPRGGPEEARPTLAQFVPDREIGWHVVAPLDFPAEGVILLTTDGELAEKMSRGGGSVGMTYHLKYQGVVNDEDVGRLLRGWRWDRRPIKPESVTALATTGKNSWVEMVIRESRSRVLKASGEAIRKTLLEISRVKLGPLSFETLGMGEARDLSKAEVNALRRASGSSAETTVDDVADAIVAAEPGGGGARGRGARRTARPLERPQGAARPDRPLQRPPRPQASRPDRPPSRPDRPPSRTDRPQRSERPQGARPDRPQRSERPQGARLDRPERSGRPQPGRPQPGRPQPGRPADAGRSSARFGRAERPPERTTERPAKPGPARKPGPSGGAKGERQGRFGRPSGPPDAGGRKPVRRGTRRDREAP